jgi:hypothetical protein
MYGSPLANPGNISIYHFTQSTYVQCLLPTYLPRVSTLAIDVNSLAILLSEDLVFPHELSF